MTHKNMKKLCDIATEAHTRFQQEIEHVNPIVGVNQGMRKSGIPVDVMTIDCLKNGMRIILILHDEQPDSISYQFSKIEDDPGNDFTKMPFNNLSGDMVLEWMKKHLAGQ